MPTSQGGTIETPRGRTDPREQVVMAARRMRALGLVTGTIGNVSLRIDGGMLITPTRVYPEDLAPRAIVEITLDGEGGRGEPSLEWRLHAEIYRRRFDVRAIAHTHSPHAVARSFSEGPLIVETEERTYLGLERIEVAAPHEAGSPELATAAAEALGDRPAALLAHHGAVATGEMPRDAVELAGTVEFLAQVDILRFGGRGPEGESREPFPRFRRSTAL